MQKSAKLKKSSIIWVAALLFFGVWWYFQRGPGLPAPGPYVVSGSESASLESLVARSQEESKPLVFLFTGSDWCPPCKLMARSVFSQPEWEAFVREEIIFVVYDFPRSGGSGPEAVHRGQMAERVGAQAFPTLVVVDAAGAVRDRRAGYQRGGPEDYIDWIRGRSEIEGSVEGN